MIFYPERLLTLFFALWVLSGEARAGPGVMAAGSRNVRDYGAKGDGHTDDTQAFRAALQQGRSTPQGFKAAASVYIPPGRYLIRSTLIIWSRTHVFGDWTDPPTLVLAPDSAGFQDPAKPLPFLVTAGGYKVPDDTTDWQTRTGEFNGSTNNTFFIIVRDLRVEIASNNPGAWAIYWWCAQQTALRNVQVDCGPSSRGCLNTGGQGGGSTIAGCTFTGGQEGYFSSDTSMELLRDCTFTGQAWFAVDAGGFAMYTFQNLRFNRTGPFLLRREFYGVAALLGCSFQHAGGIVLPPDQLQRSLHLENVSFDQPAQIPPFLKPVALKGTVRQWSNSEVVNKGRTVSGSDSSLRRAAYGAAFLNRPLPRPGPACVNIRTVGAVGDGLHDDTSAIRRALSAHRELFFPPGNYRVTEPIIVEGGHKLFGAGVLASVVTLDAQAPDFRAGSTRSLLTVNGARSAGVAFYGLAFYNNAPGGHCLTWRGDPSSTVLDCQFLNTGASGLSPINIAGGGFFENMWTPAGGNPQSDGIVVSSHAPLFLNAVQPEHYTEQALTLNGAANVVLTNLQLESSSRSGHPGTRIQITDGSRIYACGILVGNYQPASYLVGVVGGRNLSLWNLLAYGVPCIVQDTSQEGIRTYGPAPGNGRQEPVFTRLTGFVK
jgi:hypothetical protein